MKFEDLKRRVAKEPTAMRDVALAYYQEFMTVEQAYTRGDIPESYRPFLNPLCDCGSERIVKDSLTVITCCDPHCPHKVANAMARMFQKYGIANLGVATCETITKWGIRTGLFEIPTHTEVLRITSKDYSTLGSILGARWEDLLAGLAVIRSAPLTFGGLISHSCIPDFDSSAEQLFSKMNSFSQLFGLYDENKMVSAFVSAGVSSPRKLTNLYNHLVTLLLAETGRATPLMMSGKTFRNLVITGGISVDGHSITRDDFVQLCNTESKTASGVQLYTFRKSKAVQSCDSVIADYASSSKTFTQAYAREQAQGIKLIMTAQEFLDRLRQEVKAYG